jgi:putative transposase
VTSPRDRKEARRRLTIALEQTSYADAKQMLRELERWLQTKNESAAASEKPLRSWSRSIG